MSEPAGLGRHNIQQSGRSLNVASEPGTKPSGLSSADEGVGESGRNKVEIGASFLAGGEPADSHSTHKVTSVRESIEAAGTRLLCLPTYSSELNPIKFAFANNKAIARSAAQAVSDFRAAIQHSLLALKPVECRNYYMAAGYEDEAFASSRSGFGPIGSTSFMLRAPSYNSAPRPRGVEWPPIRPDTGRSREGLGGSLGVRLCRTTRSGSRSSPGASAAGATPPTRRCASSRRRCSPA